MTQDELSKLEAKRTLLIDNYQVRLKQTSPLLKGSMIMSFKQGMQGMLEVIFADYDLTSKVKPEEKP